MSSSESNTRAGPEKRRPSLPVILPTAPPGARLPRRIEMWPRDFTAVSMGATMVWPSASGDLADVLPERPAGDGHLRPSM